MIALIQKFNIFILLCGQFSPDWPIFGNDFDDTGEDVFAHLAIDWLTSINDHQSSQEKTPQSTQLQHDRNNTDNTIELSHDPSPSNVVMSTTERDDKKTVLKKQKNEGEYTYDAITQKDLEIDKKTVLKKQKNGREDNENRIQINKADKNNTVRMIEPSKPPTRKSTFSSRESKNNNMTRRSRPTKMKQNTFPLQTKDQKLKRSTPVSGHMKSRETLKNILKTPSSYKKKRAADPLIFKNKNQQYPEKITKTVHRNSSSSKKQHSQLRGPPSKDILSKNNPSSSLDTKKQYSPQMTLEDRKLHTVKNNAMSYENKNLFQNNTYYQQILDNIPIVFKNDNFGMMQKNMMLQKNISNGIDGQNSAQTMQKQETNHKNMLLDQVYDTNDKKDEKNRGPPIPSFTIKDEKNRGPPIPSFTIKDEKRRGPPIPSFAIKDEKRRGPPIPSFTIKDKNDEKKKGPVLPSKTDKIIDEYINTGSESLSRSRPHDIDDKISVPFQNNVLLQSEQKQPPSTQIISDLTHLESLNSRFERNRTKKNYQNNKNMIHEKVSRNGKPHWEQYVQSNPGNNLFNSDHKNHRHIPQDGQGREQYMQSNPDDNLFNSDHKNQHHTSQDGQRNKNQTKKEKKYIDPSSTMYRSNRNHGTMVNTSYNSKYRKGTMVSNTLLESKYRKDEMVSKPSFESKLPKRNHNRMYDREYYNDKNRSHHSYSNSSLESKLPKRNHNHMNDREYYNDKNRSHHSYSNSSLESKLPKRNHNHMYDREYYNDSSDYPNSNFLQQKKIRVHRGTNKKSQREKREHRGMNKGSQKKKWKRKGTRTEDPYMESFHRVSTLKGEKYDETPNREYHLRDNSKNNLIFSTQKNERSHESTRNKMNHNINFMQLKEEIKEKRENDNKVNTNNHFHHSGNEDKSVFHKKRESDNKINTNNHFHDSPMLNEDKNVLHKKREKGNKINTNNHFHHSGNEEEIVFPKENREKGNKINTNNHFHDSPSGNEDNRSVFHSLFFTEGSNRRDTKNQHDSITMNDKFMKERSLFFTKESKDTKSQHYTVTMNKKVEKEKSGSTFRISQKMIKHRKDVSQKSKVKQEINKLSSPITHDSRSINNLKKKDSIGRIPIVRKESTKVIGRLRKNNSKIAKKSKLSVHASPKKNRRKKKKLTKKDKNLTLKNGLGRKHANKDYQLKIENTSTNTQSLLQTEKKRNFQITEKKDPNKKSLLETIHDTNITAQKKEYKKYVIHPIKNTNIEPKQEKKYAHKKSVIEPIKDTNIEPKVDKKTFLQKERHIEPKKNNNIEPMKKEKTLLQKERHFESKIDGEVKKPEEESHFDTIDNRQLYFEPIAKVNPDVEVKKTGGREEPQLETIDRTLPYWKRARQASMSEPKSLVRTKNKKSTQWKSDNVLGKKDLMENWDPIIQEKIDIPTQASLFLAPLNDKKPDPVIPLEMIKNITSVTDDESSDEVETGLRPYSVKEIHKIGNTIHRLKDRHINHHKENKYVQKDHHTGSASAQKISMGKLAEHHITAIIFCITVIIINFIACCGCYMMIRKSRSLPPSGAMKSMGNEVDTPTSMNSDVSHYGSRKQESKKMEKSNSFKRLQASQLSSSPHQPLLIQNNDNNRRVSLLHDLMPKNQSNNDGNRRVSLLYDLIPKNQSKKLFTEEQKNMKNKNQGKNLFADDQKCKSLERIESVETAATVLETQKTSAHTKQSSSDTSSSSIIEPPAENSSSPFGPVTTNILEKKVLQQQKKSISLDQQSFITEGNGHTHHFLSPNSKKVMLLDHNDNNVIQVDRTVTVEVLESTPSPKDTQEKKDGCETVQYIEFDSNKLLEQDEMEIPKPATGSEKHAPVQKNMPLVQNKLLERHEMKPPHKKIRKRPAHGSEKHSTIKDSEKHITIKNSEEPCNGPYLENHAPMKHPEKQSDTNNMETNDMKRTSNGPCSEKYVTIIDHEKEGETNGIETNGMEITKAILKSPDLQKHTLREQSPVPALEPAKFLPKYEEIVMSMRSTPPESPRRSTHLPRVPDAKKM